MSLQVVGNTQGHFLCVTHTSPPSPDDHSLNGRGRPVVNTSACDLYLARALVVFCHVTIVHVFSKRQGEGGRDKKQHAVRRGRPVSPPDSLKNEGKWSGFKIASAARPRTSTAVVIVTALMPATENAREPLEHANMVKTTRSHTRIMRP